MTSTWRSLALFATVALSACAGSDAPSAPSTGRSDLRGGKPGSRGSNIAIVDLGTLGGSFSATYAINDLNQIVGASTNAQNATRAFRWANGVFTDLGVLPGKTSSQANDINEAGQVVGTSFGGTSQARAFRWSSGNMLELPPPAGYCCSEAHGINDAGDVAGAVSLTVGSPHAAIWRDGVPTDLQAAGTGEGFAWDISNTGQVVGTFYSDFATGASQGSFIWTAEAGFELLDGAADGGEGLAITTAGQIAGWSRPEEGQNLEAYLWQSGTKQFLGALGGASSVAIGVSDGAPLRVVGRADVKRSHHAFVWTASGGMMDLGLPKGRSSGQAWDVNSTGWIVGETSSPGGATRATLWRLP